jgi:hypothetical protein
MFALNARRLGVSSLRIASSRVSTNQSAGFRVVDEIFGFWIPAQLSSRYESDIRQVTGTDRPVMGENIRDRLLSFFHTMDEISHVISRLAIPVQLNNFSLEPP